MNRAVPVASSPDTVAGVIATLRFSVREPVGKNATFARGKGRRLYRTDEATEFRDRIRTQAYLHRCTSDWPSDPFRPLSVRVTTQLWNTRHDADAVQAMVRDALQKTLYQDDRICSNGANEPPKRDDGERRVEVTVELLAIRTEAEAAKLRAASERRTVARVKKPKARKITITVKKRAI